MSEYTEKIGNRLNDLLEKNYDAEKGYTKAAENAQHPGLKSYFSNKAKERYDFGHQIKAELRNYGQAPDKGGSVTGAAHRTWMEVKSWFSADDDEAMLEEAIRGEKASVEEYREVLNETALPASTQQVLQVQKNTIEHDLANIKTMEDLT